MVNIMNDTRLVDDIMNATRPVNDGSFISRAALRLSAHRQRKEINETKK